LIRLRLEWVSSIELYTVRSCLVPSLVLSPLIPFERTSLSLCSFSCLARALASLLSLLSLDSASMLKLSISLLASVISTAVKNASPIGSCILIG